MQRDNTVSNPMVEMPAGRQEHGVRHFFLLLMLVTLLLIAAPPGQAVIGAERTPQVSEQDAKWQPPPMPEPAPFATVDITSEEAKQLVDKWGVELLGMRLTTAGYMLDFRFRVLDVDKALPLFDHRIKPHIVAERSNIKLPVPMSTKVGAFRPTNRGKNIKADKTYYMIFGNPDRHLKVGEMVTVVIGDFKVEHLKVN